MEEEFEESFKINDEEFSHVHKFEDFELLNSIFTPNPLSTSSLKLNKLPPEIIELISLNLNLRSIFSLGRTCKDFKWLLTNEILHLKVITKMIPSICRSFEVWNLTDEFYLYFEDLFHIPSLPLLFSRLPSLKRVLSLIPDDPPSSSLPLPYHITIY